MAIICSTGLAKHLMVTGSAFAAFDGDALIKVYSGAVPATADALEGTVIWTISSEGGGTGLNFETAADTSNAAAPAMVKLGSETWSGTVTAAGPATYWRMVNVADDGTLSTTAKRIQGSCGSTGQDMYLATTTLTPGAKSMSAFSLALPLNV